MMMKYAIFAYDFPHTKSRDFILALSVLDKDIDCILAAPKIKLNLPEPTLRIAVKQNEFFHPREIAALLGIPYFVVPHNSPECIRIIKERNIDIGVIGGARILAKEVIEAFNYGVLNFHPGLIPDNRGLDNLKWAIYLNIPQGVTTHFIDERVDAGRIILQEVIPVYEDDTLFDVNQRLYETQLKLIKPTLDLVEEKKDITYFARVEGGKVRSVMPAETEKKIPRLFERYKKEYNSICKRWKR